MPPRKNSSTLSKARMPSVASGFQSQPVNQSFKRATNLTMLSILLLGLSEPAMAANASLGDSAGYYVTGDYNTALGYWAGYAVTGDYNNALGTYAGKNVTGSYNNALGYQAGQYVIGDDNTAMGYQAGMLVKGDDNNALGYYAGVSVIGDDNNALGTNAGIHVTGSFNNALGYYAGRYVTGDHNTALGTNAGYGVSGSSNNALGDSAGLSVSGSYNNALGYYAGVSVTGDYNTALGYQAGMSVIGDMNTALGLNAGMSVSGDSNNALGYWAGYGVSGDNNTAMGYRAGQSVSGSDNVALGTNAGRSVSGSYNNALGSFAGQSVSGSSNNALGYLAGVSVTGDYNTALGYQAGMSVSGDMNTALGLNAGMSVSGDSNNALGYWAGYGVSGDNNTAMGYRAGQSVSGSDNVALGTSAGSSIVASRTVSIGNSATASADDAIALGSGSTVTGESSIAIGTGHSVSGSQSGAFGDPTTITGDGSYSVGNDNTIANDNAFVLGNSVTTTQDNSVVLGNLSTDRASAEVTDATAGDITISGFAGTAVGVVSVGAEGSERQIINVAPGEVSATSTDAVNGSQLYSVMGEIDSLGVSAYSGWSLSADGLNTTTVESGESVDFNSEDDNIVVSKTSDSNDVTFDLADEITVKSVTAEDETSNEATLSTSGLSVTDGTNSTLYGADGVTFGSGTVSLSSSGLDNGGYVITGVAAGDLSATSTDAVNGSQLYSVMEEIDSLSDSAYSGWSLSADGSNTTTVDAGESVDFNSEDGNIEVSKTSDSNDVTFDLADNITVESVTAEDETSNEATLSTSGLSVTDGTNSATYEADGVTFDGSTVSLSSTGLDNGDNVITGVADGEISATSTEAVNGSQLYSVIDSLGDSAYSGWSLSADGSNTTSVESGDTVDLKNSDGNIEVSKTSDSNDVTFNLADDITVDSLTAGNTVVDTDGVKVDDGTDSTTYGVDGMRITDGPSVTSAGIDAAGLTVSSVAAGELSQTSTDAVNGSQLYATNQIAEQQGTSISQILGGGSTYDATTGVVSTPTYFVDGESYDNVGSAISALDIGLAGFDNQLSALSNRLDRVGAMSAAMSGVQASSFNGVSPTQLGLAGGFYNGKYALALGLNTYASRRVLFNIGGAMSEGEAMGRVGVTVALGSSSKPRLSGAVSSEVLTLRNIVTQQNAQISQQDQQIQELVKRLSTLESKL